MVKNPPADAGNTGSVSGSGRSPGEENGNTLLPGKHSWATFLPGKSHGQMSLEGYSPKGSKRAGHSLSTKQLVV